MHHLTPTPAHVGQTKTCQGSAAAGSYTTKSLPRHVPSLRLKNRCRVTPAITGGWGPAQRLADTVRAAGVVHDAVAINEPNEPNHADTTRGRALDGRRAYPYSATDPAIRGAVSAEALRRPHIHPSPVARRAAPLTAA